jgi:hypothetical protein
MSDLSTDIYQIPIGSIISRRGDNFEVAEFLGIEEKEYQGKQGLRKYKLGKYIAYQLKSDYSGVKGNRTELLISTDKKELEKYDKYSWHLDRENTDPNYKLKSQEKIDTDKRRASTGESKLEWQGAKPAYLMTKAEYNESVTKKFREFNRFIIKNGLYFSKPDYYGVNYLDWKRFKESWVKKYQHDTVESSFKQGRSRDFRDAEIEQASPELIKQFDSYMDFFTSVFGKENLSKMQSDEGGSNKRSIRRAIDDGTYEKLLREGKVNYAFLKTVFSSVGVTIPTKLEKIEKEVVEHGLTADVKGSFDKMTTEFIAHIKERFKVEIKYYEDWYRNLFLKSFTNLDAYCRSEKNTPYQKNIIEFYLAYSIANGYEPKPVYVNERVRIYENGRGTGYEDKKVFKGYERFHNDIEKYKDFSGKILNGQSLAKNKVELVSDWKEVLDAAAKKFANNLFESFGGRLLTEISPVNMVDKVIPKIESAVLNSVHNKGFDGFLDLVYPNGFVLSIETQIFYAGGFNIQVLHLRGLFKFQNKGKFISINEVVKAYREFNPKTDISKQVRLAEKVEEDDDETMLKLEKKHDKSGDRYYTAKQKQAEKKLKQQKHNKEITKVQESIDMYKDMLKSNPKDKEAKESLEMYKEILSELKTKKFDEGGGIDVVSKSNLTTEQQILVNSPEFISWFGDWRIIAKAKSLENNVTGFYKKMFKGNEELFLFEMSVQANNSESERSGATRVAGEELIELALKLYPNAKVGDEYYPVVSKVVDENGEPLVVYHGFMFNYGAGKRFNEFKSLPAFFSTSRRFAEQYAETKSMDGALDADIDSYACFLNIKNLFDPENKFVIELAHKELPETVKVSHGTMWFLDADIPKWEIVDSMQRIVTVTPDHMAEDILKANVGDVIPEKVAMSQYENRILVHKDDDWAYTVSEDNFNEAMAFEVADYISRSNDSVPTVKYKDKYLPTRFLNKETYRYEKSTDPLYLEYLDKVSERKKYYIENILSLPRESDDESYFTIEVKNPKGHERTLYVKKRNLKTYKTTTKDNWTTFENEQVQKFLVGNNFGGWISYEKGDKAYAVYDAHNIKLADGTNKTFDGSNPDIRFGGGGKLNCDWNKEKESCDYGCKKDGGNVTDNKKIKILYLHGLDATPTSDHVSILEEHGVTIVAPKLDYRGGLVFGFLSDEIIDKENIQGIVGHSMGGYLAYYLSNKNKIPCLMFNPAFGSENLYLQPIPDYDKELPLYRNQIAVIGSEDKDVPTENQLQFLEKTKAKLFVEEMGHDVPDNIKVKYFNEFVKNLQTKKMSNGGQTPYTKPENKFEDGQVLDLKGYGKVKIIGSAWLMPPMTARPQYIYDFVLNPNVRVTKYLKNDFSLYEYEVEMMLADYNTGIDYEKSYKLYLGSGLRATGNPPLEYVRFIEVMNRSLYYYNHPEFELNPPVKSFYEAYAVKGNKFKDGGAMLAEKISPTVNELGFYSPIEKRVLEFKQDKATVNKWKDIVGIKTDEAKYTGLADYLNSKKPDETLLKIELLNFIKDNHIELIIVNKNDQNTFLDETHVKERENGTYGLAYNDSDEFVNDDEFDSPQELKDVYENEEIYSGNDVPYKTKYSKYVLSGEAENYNEVLVMLPDKAQQNRLFYNKLFNILSENIKQRLNIIPDTIDWNTFNIRDKEYKRQLTADELQQLNYIDSLANTKIDVFSTPHWEERNILVHLRYDIRTDVNGDKVLLASEIQSDFGQRGKKIGFKGKYDIEKLNPELIEAENEYNKLDFVKLKISEIWETPEANRVMDIKEKISQEEKSIPLAPFVTDTNKWVKLGLKILIQQAALSDVKYLSWMTGEQENDLYDLSKSLSRISWWHITDIVDNGWGITTYDKENRIILKKRDITLDEIEKTIGKEAAEKIKNHVGKDSEVGRTVYGELESDDLKLTGSGMIGFYGSVINNELGIVGNVLKSLVKELTGKSEIITIELESSRQYAVEITPELKLSVDEGIPMFKVGGQLNKKNPYAICTVSLGRVIGTQKRSEWTPTQLKKYEGCVLKVKKQMNYGGQLFTVLYMDKDGKNIVYSKDGYKIAVNDPKDARYITLWYNDERVGVLEARESYLNNYHGHTGKFLTIAAAYVDKPHQGKGFGLKMYQVLHEFSADDVLGFFSDLTNRQNKKVIPKIYSHFNNEIVGDYHIVTYHDGGVVGQTLYFAIYKNDNPNDWFMVAKYHVNNEGEIITVKKMVDKAHDDGFKVKAITKKEYEDYDLGDEINTDEATKYFNEKENNKSEDGKTNEFKKGGSMCSCKFRDGKVPSKGIYEQLYLKN